jgi:all-trans-retinol dehydrogenase (NAD+)
MLDLGEAMSELGRSHDCGQPRANCKAAHKETTMKNLTNKRVLITGAGHGLGLETARRFAQEGAEVIISDIDTERVENAVFELQSKGLPAFGYVMDVTDPTDVQRVRDRIHAEHGTLDVLVNNAGIVSGGEFLNVPLEKHICTFEVNTLGPVIVTHAFLNDLLNKDEANVVFIASASAMIPLPNAATYASSKWGVLGFAESLREELIQDKDSHVTVSAICPSYIATGMFEGVKPPLLVGMLTPEWLAGKIVACVKKRKEQVMAPALVKIIPLAKATWPRRAFRVLLRLLGVFASMDAWKGNKRQTAPQADAQGAHSDDEPDVIRYAG